MKDKTISYLKEILSNNNFKESIKEVNDLIQLGYVLNVMLLINTIDEVIVQAKNNNEVVIDFKVNIEIIDATNFKFLSYELYFDGKKLLPKNIEYESKRKMNEVINAFTNDNINKFFKKNYSIEMQLDEYNKSKLAENVLSNMLPSDMKKTVDFVLLDNSIIMNQEEVVNKRKNKI